MTSAYHFTSVGRLCD